MAKKKKKVLYGALTVLLGLALGSGIFLMNMRWEFEKHLEGAFPELTFSVGLAKIDPIYEKSYARATCLEDGTVFTIAKGFKSKEISENYLMAKSQIGYNDRIRDVFSGSGLEKDLKSATGGGKELFEEDSPFAQINLHLAEEADHAQVVEEALNLLREAGISAELIIAEYEKEGHVYEIRLSDADYNLTAADLVMRTKRIK